MAYQHQYDRPDRERINYHELEQSTISTRGILITFGIIALAVAAMFMVGEVTTSNIDPAVTGQVPSTVPGETAPLQ